MSRRLLAFIAVAGLAGCNGITPTAPAPAAAVTALTAASINIIPSPAQLPPAGGISTLYVEVLSAGGAGVRDATVTLTTSTGQLTSTTVRTDSTGHGTTEWSGDRTGRITASLGELSTSTTIQVLVPSGPVPPGPGPGPGPGPPPPPPPPGPPAPPPGPPTPPPGAAGDLVLTITPSLAAPNASQSVTWTATMTSSTGATVPFMDRFGWDLNGDGLVDRVEASPVVTYAQGTYTAFLEVRTSDNRAVTATRFITVAPAPTLTAALSATPSATNIATPVTFTATVSSVGATGGVISYGWDFTNDGTIDQTTAVNTATKIYNDATLGAKTARVVATSANGQTGTATTIVTLAEPAMTVDISSVVPAGSQPAGTLLTITATVTSAGNVPASMTFGWDYNNDGTVDETTTGSSPRSVGHTYNASGSQTVKVTVTAPDGRTATNTRVIPVS